MLKGAQKLDYKLQAYQERLGLVNFLIETGQLDGYPPSELDKVANYLLLAASYSVFHPSTNAETTAFQLSSD